ncbi:esterase FE4-like isoform X2 [Phymastichus coffea]|uniref:esterase FE4-like isoform X2 n=1 Tax=Phymastichus coffea TaxID=108790 RepID=UPI00273C4644|nr:esterase FE4-like isoform X2 [Phymastichus coffea]
MEDLIVETRNGQVRGTIKKSVEGYSYCAFLGIPYAKPPIDNLRFKDPEAIDNWTGIKSATEYGNPCAQDDSVGVFYGSEDCLYLNVCVRSLKNVNELKPVMVWIHGGGYLQGCGDDKYYGPDYLLRKDIVFVSFNYRLGIFGFLNLDHEIVAGNMGIKDQIMALRWVQANISKFGGDPNNVTVFGESSGATSVQILCLCPQSKDLFHKAILQSGSIQYTWVITKTPKKYGYQLCTMLGKYNDDPNEIYKFLMTLDTRKLVQLQDKLRRTTDKLHCLFVFTLGIDNKSPNPVMPVHPDELMTRSIEKPCLFGHNNAEGLIYLMGLEKSDFERINRSFNSIINERATELLKGYGLTKQDLRYMYFKDERITLSNCVKFAFLLADLYILDGIHKFANTQVEKNPHPQYFYQFSYDDEPSCMKTLLPVQSKGACHCDELDYVFYSNFRTQKGFKPFQKGTPSYKVMERMTELWTNFAAHGTPTPSTSDIVPEEWKPLDNGTNLRYMDIGRDLTMKTMTNIREQYIAYKAAKDHSSKQ